MVREVTRTVEVRDAYDYYSVTGDGDRSLNVMRVISLPTSDPSTIHVRANEASLDMLWSRDALTITAPPQRVTMRIATLGDFEREPALHETWGYIQYFLSPTDASFSKSVVQAADVDNLESVVTWLEGCTRLTRFEMTTPVPEFISPVT
jgi:hypothetical protein